AARPGRLDAGAAPEPERLRSRPPTAFGDADLLPGRGGRKCIGLGLEPGRASPAGNPDRPTRRREPALRRPPPGRGGDRLRPALTAAPLASGLHPAPFSRGPQDGVAEDGRRV